MSTDDTAAIARDAARRHPRLRVLPGLQVLRASGPKVKVRLRLREPVLDGFIHALQERAGGGGRSGGCIRVTHSR